MWSLWVLLDKVTNLRRCDLRFCPSRRFQGPQTLGRKLQTTRVGSAQGHMQGTRGFGFPATTQRCRCHISNFTRLVSSWQHMLETSTVHEDDESKARVGCSRRERHDANSTSVDVSRFTRTAGAAGGQGIRGISNI